MDDVLQPVRVPDVVAMNMLDERRIMFAPSFPGAHNMQLDTSAACYLSTYHAPDDIFLYMHTMCVSWFCMKQSAL
jgi:hypothetical protein